MVWAPSGQAACADGLGGPLSSSAGWCSGDWVGGATSGCAAGEAAGMCVRDALRPSASGGAAERNRTKQKKSLLSSCQAARAPLLLSQDGTGAPPPFTRPSPLARTCCLCARDETPRSLSRVSLLLPRPPRPPPGAGYVEESLGCGCHGAQGVADGNGSTCRGCGGVGLPESRPIQLRAGTVEGRSTRKFCRQSNPCSQRSIRPSLLSNTDCTLQADTFAPWLMFRVSCGRKGQGCGGGQPPIAGARAHASP